MGGELSFNIPNRLPEAGAATQMKTKGTGREEEKGRTGIGPSSIEAIDHVHHKLRHVLPSA